MNVQPQPKRKQKTAKVKAQSEPAASHQRYATFSLELLLNDDNTVRRTKLTHMQSGESQTWAEWVASEVTAYIESREQLHPSVLSAPEQSETSQQKSDSPRVAAASQAQTFPNAHAAHLSLLGVMCEGKSEYSTQLSREQPYTFRLALDISDEGLSRNASLKYEAFVQAKQLGSGNKAKIGATSGICARWQTRSDRRERREACAWNVSTWRGRDVAYRERARQNERAIGVAGRWIVEHLLRLRLATEQRIEVDIVQVIEPNV